MSTLEKDDVFDMVNDNQAYVVYAKKGTLIRSNDNPILFIAGEDSQYKFLLRSAFVLAGNKLNLLLMSVNDMVTPNFSMRLKCMDRRMKSIFDREILLCPHGTQVSSGQHFYAEIDIPDYTAVLTKHLSLRINIGGSKIPFCAWSSDMKSISIVNNNYELILPMGKLAVK